MSVFIIFIYYRFIHEKLENPKLRPHKILRKRKNILEKLQENSPEMVLKIREIVHREFEKTSHQYNAYPTLKSIRRGLHEMPEFASWSIYTVRNVLQHMGFRFKQRHHINAALLIQDPFIISRRKHYIQKIRQLRAEGNVYSH